MVELHNIDCLEFMRTMQKNSVFAIVTDPPYGINRDKGFGGAQPFGGKTGRKIKRKSYRGSWDSKRPTAEHFKEMLRVAKIQIIFGGNFFSDLLPVGTHWIAWDKLNTMPTFGDMELAWTNIKRNSIKKVTCEYNGLIGKEEKRVHATQKPLKLMTWILVNYTQEGDVIFDPFTGSGTTGVACVRLGRDFIGCEIDEDIFKVAERRIQDAAKQGNLFAHNNAHEAEQSPPRQVSWLDSVRCGAVMPREAGG